MRFSSFSSLCLLSSAVTANTLPQLSKRDAAQFVQGQPIDGNGKGGPILGELDPRRVLKLKLMIDQAAQTNSWIFKIQTIWASSLLTLALCPI
jgi:hypothetical protein